MPQAEPKNPFYFLLLLSSLLFAITAVAYAIVPLLEQRARDAGQMMPPSIWRDSLCDDGWMWLLVELTAMVVFALASMGLDRLRTLKKQRAENTIAAAEQETHR